MVKVCNVLAVTDGDFSPIEKQSCDYAWSILSWDK